MWDATLLNRIRDRKLNEIIKYALSARLNPGAPSVQLRGAQGWARVMQTAQLWIQCKMTSSPWCRNDLETW